MPKGVRGFKKGQSGNILGKPKGIKSEKTLAWEQLGDFITESGAVRVKEILSKCTQKEFMIYYPMLLEYFKPKQQRVENNVTLEDNTLQINRKVLTKNIGT